MTETTFFESEQVQENLNDIFNTYHEIASQTNHLHKMSKEKRLEHIDKCKDLIDRQKNFYTRLTLASKEDAEAADMRSRIDALSQAFGYASLIDCMEAMLDTLGRAQKTQSESD
jgi:hypothetical protein|tara:strand:+ start:370 stop:711 length:342 start_codon:yes stop_codon:yes gene_type:complete